MAPQNRKGSKNTVAPAARRRSSNKEAAPVAKRGGPGKAVGTKPLTIILDGVERELIPSIEALAVITAHGETIWGLIGRLRNLDFSAFNMVIAVALKVDAVAAAKLPEQVYQAKLTSLVLPLTRYLEALAYGGEVQPEIVELSEKSDV